MKYSQAVGIIPARYGSTRFPGKPLALIAGKPMIQHVYENAVSARNLSRVLVATDDDRIAACVRGFGGECIMTDSDIATGTERIAQAAKSVNAGIILNIQGDEPLASPDLMDALVEALRHNDVPVCTPVVRIASLEELSDPNQVRVVFDDNLHALYFTRAVIPFNRDANGQSTRVKTADYWKHIGIYCFRRDFLFTFVNLPYGRLEQVEKLEQLRILENGFPILIVKTTHNPVCVDVPDDIAKVEAALSSL